jgi:methionine aminotransferase
MSKMAADFDAINLSQGFPDFDVSPKLTGLVNEAMQKGFNQYAPMQGLPELRNVIGESLKSTYDWSGDSLEQITITAGATEALYSCISALIHSGDEVIVFEPAYDSYLPAIELNGGIGVPLLLNPKDFSIPCCPPFMQNTKSLI